MKAARMGTCSAKWTTRSASGAWMAKRCGSDQEKKISLEDISSGGWEFPSFDFRRSLVFVALTDCMDDGSRIKMKKRVSRREEN
jgi:hypothetical protein